jgi:hypothetical protein
MEQTPDNHEVVIKYSSYTDAQKRATQKYRSNNKDKINEQRKKYYNERKETDPEFLEYKRIKSKEYYTRKKSLLPADIEFIDPEPVVKADDKREPEPVVKSDPEEYTATPTFKEPEEWSALPKEWVEVKKDVKIKKERKKKQVTQPV